MSLTVQAFGQDIWIASGPTVVAAAGFHYPTRMTLIRLVNGQLVVVSPIGLTGELRQAVDALGQVCFLVAPNSLHHVFMSDWQDAYPAARTFAAPGLASKRPDLKIDATFDMAQIAEWNGQLEHVAMRGNAITTEVVFFHRPSATVIFTDLLQNFPKDWFLGWRSVIAKLDLMAEPRPTVPRKFRLAFRRRTEARAALQAVLKWPSDKVLMAHGDPVQANGRAFIRQAFEWL